MSSTLKDYPGNLLAKESYQFLLMKVKPTYLNSLFKVCCYTQSNSYKIYKWIPNDKVYDRTNGEAGKRIMKIKEESSMC